MRYRPLFAILLLLIVFGIGIRESYQRGKTAGYSDGYSQGSAGPLQKSAENPESSAFTKETFADKINKTRQTLGLTALATDTNLEQIAQNDINEACGKIKQADFRLNSDASRFADYSLYGEIVSEDTTDPADVLKEWAGNPNHQPVLLRPDFAQMGIGIKDTCVSVVFGTKK